MADELLNIKPGNIYPLTIINIYIKLTFSISSIIIDCVKAEISIDVFEEVDVGRSESFRPIKDFMALNFKIDIVCLVICV